MLLPDVGYNAVKAREIIDMYEKLHPIGPDSIYESIMDAKTENLELKLSHKIDTNGVINGNEAGRRLYMAMPSALYIMLRKQMPTIFKEDMKQFEKDFPVFFKAWR